MTSQIDPTVPVAGTPTTESVRANFATAANEISGLQVATQNAPFLPLSGGTMAGAMLLYNDPTQPMSPVTLGYFQANGGGGGGGGISDAPADSTTYGRNNARWVNVLPLTGGTLTGLTIVHPAGQSDPFRISVDNGNTACAVFTVLGTRAWNAGTLANGNFAISDQSGGFEVLTLDLSKNATFAGAVNASSLAITNNATIGGTLTTSGNVTFDGALTVEKAATINALTVNNDATINGALNLIGKATVNAVVASGGQIEVGGQSGTVTPAYIDFHTTGGNEDYNARLDANGGTLGTVGSATLEVLAANFHPKCPMNVDGGVTVPNQKGYSFTDTAGAHCNFVLQSDNNFCFYGTTNTGTARAIWTSQMASATGSFAVDVPMSVNAATTHNGNVTVNGGVNITQTVTAGTVQTGALFLGYPGVGDWRFVRDAGYRIHQWRSDGWADSWNEGDGTRGWSSPSATLMTLDGSGNLWVKGTITSTTFSCSGNANVNGTVWVGSGNGVVSPWGMRYGNYFVGLDWGGAASPQINFLVNGGGASGQLVCTFADSNVSVLNAMALDGNGSVLGWYGNSSSTVSWPITWSARDLKSNIAPATIDALDTLQKLTVYSCDLTPPLPDAATQHWDCALMADEIEPLIPPAFIAAPEGGYDSINSLPLICVMVKAIQQLAERVAALEAPPTRH